MAFRRSPVRSRSGPPAFAHDQVRRLSRRSPEGAEADVIPRIQPRVSYGSASHAKDADIAVSTRSDRARAGKTCQPIRVRLRFRPIPAIFLGISFDPDIERGRRKTRRLHSEKRGPSPSFLCRSDVRARARVADHNAGRCPHTARSRPWQLHVVIEFPDEQRAVRFERYLKSGSGRAFAKNSRRPQHPLRGAVSDHIAGRRRGGASGHFAWSLTPWNGCCRPLRQQRHQAGGTERRPRTTGCNLHDDLQLPDALAARESVSLTGRNPRSTGVEGGTPRTRPCSPSCSPQRTATVQAW
jgi:hypothetical protein